VWWHATTVTVLLTSGQVNGHEDFFERVLVQKHSRNQNTRLTRFSFASTWQKKESDYELARVSSIKTYRLSILLPR
jgi:hypothetical protein